MKDVTGANEDVADTTFSGSRRQLLTCGAAAGLAAAAAAVLVPTAGYSATVYDIPELASQWKKLNLAEILKLPAAYVSISQSKSLYDAGGAQSGEKHRERGSLEATIKVVDAARKAKNFISFNWVGYTIFRQNYPQSIFDKVQYESWIEGLNWSPEKIAWDDEIVGELQASFSPATTTCSRRRCRRPLLGRSPLELARKRIQVIVLTGIHLDWCIEGNARAARDYGYLPIVIGDATATQKPEQAKAAFERINNFFAPVISADTFVKLLSHSA
jgi:nicotinamidase-related amidase